MIFFTETEEDSDDSDIIILPDEPKSPQQDEEDDYNNRYWPHLCQNTVGSVTEPKFEQENNLYLKN